MRASTQGLAILYPFRCRIGSTTPSVSGIEKLVGVPGGRERTGFRLTVADDAGDDQVGIVVCRPIGVRDRIPQFAAFVNGAGSLRRHVAGNAARETRTA